MNILIAEDEKTNFLLLKRFLKGLTKEILHAMNGKEAVEFVASYSIDLILMDLRMPIMTGYEAAEEIRKFNQVVPIIAQTAYVDIADKQKAMESGCNEILEKPIEKQLLISTIKKYL